jgi:hypothetical protein
MDEMLFPEEALAFLRQARYDPGACRGLECLSTSFHWSDERLPQAMRLCMNHGSRATFYLMVFRTSLIKGEPIAEYRPTWDQLRAACPGWPGFRRERCGTDLLPAWERALKRSASASSARCGDQSVARGRRPNQGLHLTRRACRLSGVHCSSRPPGR